MMYEKVQRLTREGGILCNWFVDRKLTLTSEKQLYSPPKASIANLLLYLAVPRMDRQFGKKTPV